MRRPALPEPFRVGVRPLGDDAPFRRDDTDGAREHGAALFARDPRAVYRRVGDAGDPVAPATLDALERAGNATLELVRAALAGGGAAPPRPPTTASAAQVPGPLVRAALAVAEDLVTLVRDSSGWRLVEAFVAAPSVWVLADKIGRPLGEVHDPVPGFAAGTPADRVIERMLDALRPGEPVRRGSWSLHADARRFAPRHAPNHAARLAAAAPDALFLRSERQTLHRLWDGGAVLFSIDTTIRSVGALDAAERAALDEQLAALAPEQRRYRGIATGPRRTPDA